MNVSIQIFLSDDSDIVFTDFDLATSFCEEEFGFEGEAWNYALINRSLLELYEFLVDDGVDVEYFE
jgi:hypothetical protein